MANEIEDLFLRFFKAGSKDRRHNIDPNYFRVDVCHHAKNYINSAPDEKTMDFTLALKSGQFCYCEVKQKTITSGNDAFAWIKFSDHQQEMLDYTLQRKCLGLAGIGWVDERDFVTTAFLIPWKVVRILQSRPLADPNSGKKRLWRTVTPARLRAWIPEYELVPVRLSKTQRGTKVGLFTKTEIECYNAQLAQSERVPAHLPTPFPLEIYLSQRPQGEIAHE